MKKFNPILNWYYQIYLFQLDEYNLRQYVPGLSRLLKIPPVFRKTIRWTAKLITVELVVIILELIVVFGLIYLMRLSGLVAMIGGIVMVLIFAYFHFKFLIIASLILFPLDTLIKLVIIYQAKQKLAKFPKLKIIGIAGSYGKTTMKEMLAGVLSQKYKILKTPENINTPLGIARLILNKLTSDTNIFIVEMGEYYPGDIARICKITPPDIGIITGINEAHLSRMGSLTNTTKTIFEISQNLKSNGMIWLNADDRRVVEGAKIYPVSEMKWYSSVTSSLHPYDIRNQKNIDNAAGQEFEIFIGKKKVIPIQTKLLAGYAIGDIICCYQIATQLGMNIDQIKIGVTLVNPVEHRLQPIFNQTANILVIDDSYNGNPEGAAEAIKVLSGFSKKRKIYITPGLVETGPRSQLVHREIGVKLARVADLVILVRNSVTPDIARGLESAGFNPNNIIWYTNASDLHRRFTQYIKPGDVVLFQNDWPDNYI